MENVFNDVRTALDEIKRGQKATLQALGDMRREIRAELAKRPTTTTVWRMIGTTAVIALAVVVVAFALARVA